MDMTHKEKMKKNMVFLSCLVSSHTEPDTTEAT